MASQKTVAQSFDVAFWRDGLFGMSSARARLRAAFQQSVFSTCFVAPGFVDFEPSKRYCRVLPA